MRVAVVDIGTNSTRLLIADVEAGSSAVESLSRRSQVTRLGHGVDANGTLDADSVERTWQVLTGYRSEIDEAGLRGEPRRAHLGGARRLQRPASSPPACATSSGSTRKC